MQKFLPEITAPQKNFLVQMLFTTGFITFTSGVFLSGFAAFMGGGDVLVSYISVLTNACGIFVLMFASALQRIKSQKKLTIYLTIFSRIVTISILLIPLVLAKKYQLYLFIPIIIAAFTLQGLATIALNNWLAYYTPDKKRGQYISLRQTISLIVSVVFSILGGIYLDISTEQYYGFAVLFLIAGLMAVIEINVLLRIEDNCIEVPGEEKQKRKTIFLEVLKNKKFLLYVLRVTLFYLLLFISDSFTFVFMFRYLNLSYTTITFLQMLITLPQVFLLSLWGKVSDKYGHKFVLNLSIAIFAGETFFMLLTSQKTWMIFIPIAFLVASVANSGFVISVFNRRYEIIPEHARMVYDGFFTAAISIAFIVAPLLGGVMRDLLLSSNALQSAMQFWDIRIMYAISTIGILLLQLIFFLAGRRKAHREKS